MNNSASSLNKVKQWHEAGGNDGVPPADVRIVTSDGQSIPAHSGILASESPALEWLLYRSLRKSPASERVVHILGVSYDAVLTFVEFLYSSKSLMTAASADVAMQKHSVALLVLSHAYGVQWLKRKCESGLARRLSAGNVVDVIKLARLCDVPRLYLRCMRLVAKDLAAVQQSEGWRFVQNHDQALEQEILHFLQQNEQRKKRWKRERADQDMYRQLSEAMNCLQDLWTMEKGRMATAVASDEPPTGCGKCKSSPITCQQLQHLIRHFATCGKKLEPKGCTHCKRMSQLFRLHSSICEQAESCKVPFCMTFKMKMQAEEKVDRTWTLLVKKVVTASVLCSLANRKPPEQVQIVHKSMFKHKGPR